MGVTKYIYENDKIPESYIEMNFEKDGITGHVNINNIK